VVRKRKRKNPNYQQGKKQKEDAAMKSGGHSPTKKQKLIDTEDKGDMAKAYSYAKRMKATAAASGKEHFTVHDPCEFPSSAQFLLLVAGT
jgi:hypothetical protein